MTTNLGDFHQPHNLADNKNFASNYEKAISYVKDGLSVKDTCIAVFGITDRTYRNWEKWAIDDIEAGFTADDSNLIKLIFGLSREDINLNRKLSKKAKEVALDGDVKMLQFLLKTRYGYTDKTKHDVKVSSNENMEFKINIVDSKGVANENNY